MKKILFLLAVSLLAFTSCFEDDTPDAAKSIKFRDLASLPEDTTFKKGPYLMHGTAASQTIMWETDDEADSIVEYGLTADYGHSAEGDDGVLIHEVILSDLKAETIYHYRVKSGTEISGDLSFMTSVKKDTPFRFSFISDTQDSFEVSGDLYDMMAEDGTFFVLHGGDIVSEGSIEELWQTHFADPARKLGHYVPFYMALGNHETNSHWFYDFVSYPEEENNYSFTYGNAYFLVLDTNLNGSMLDDGWLDTELASEACRNADWRFVVHHQPPWSEGWSAGCGYAGEIWQRNDLVKEYEYAGIDIVFNGHTHGYERGELNGVHYIIGGGGGGHPDVHCQDIEHITVAQYIYEYVSVDIIGNTLELSGIDRNGNVFDNLTIQK